MLLEARAIVLRAEALPAPFDSLRPHAVPKPAPEPPDWLAQHDERGQSFAAYRGSQGALPGRTLYFATAGAFGPGRGEVVRELAPLLAAYFQLEVKQLAAIPDSVASVRAREWDLGPQWLTHTIMDALEARRPPDAVAFMAVTPVDLYPDPTWNFVYGQARYAKRVGVTSIARDGDPTLERGLVLRRAFATSSHEIGHMLGIRHCIAWACAMNGVNHRLEADARTLEPCPACLAKLQLAIGFDPERRWRELAARYAGAGLGEDAWIVARASSFAHGTAEGRPRPSVRLRTPEGPDA